MAPRNEVVVGFDMDGTIVESWITNKGWRHFFFRFHNNSIFRRLANYKMKRIDPIMIPIGWCYIITSRPPWARRACISWLVRHSINYFLLETASQYWDFRCQDEKEEQTREKAEAINNFGLTEFYEDREEIRARLKKMCPDTEILPPEEAIARGRAKEWENSYEFHTVCR